MRNEHTFTRSDLEAIGWVHKHQIDNAIGDKFEEEPMLYGASIPFARKHGGPLCNMFLQEITGVGDTWLPVAEKLKGEHEAIIDTRLSFLVPGAYQAIPGWHCDFVPRVGQYSNSQPLLEMIDEEAVFFSSHASYRPHKEDGVRGRHVIDSTIAGTEFLAEVPQRHKNYKTPRAIKVKYNRDDVWRSVNEAINKKKLKTVHRSEDGQIMRFGMNTLHRALPATESGFRFFFRLAIVKRQPKNKIRRQVNVYLDPKTAGW